MNVNTARGLSRTHLLLAVIGTTAVIAGGLWLLRPAVPADRTEAAPVVPHGTVVLGAAATREAALVVGPAVTEDRRESLDAPAVLALDERRTARIGSQIEGKVLEVFVEIGDRVAAGKELAHMISPVVHDAWAAYRKAVAERRRTQNELTLAVQNEARAKRLFADKAVAELDVQRASANRVAAEEALNIINTEIRRAEEELEHLGVTNAEDPSGETGEQVPVRSPLGGVVLEKLITEGGAATPGTPLFVVSDLSTLWAMAEVDETALSKIRAGAPVEVVVTAYPGDRFQGTIAWVADVVNPKTRRVMVRCVVPNKDGRLKPDMYATVSLGEGASRAIVVVPGGAVQDIDGRPVVFVQTAPGRFEVRAVTVGAEADGRVEIRTGLQAGEHVVTQGSFLLKSELLKSQTAGD